MRNALLVVFALLVSGCTSGQDAEAPSSTIPASPAPTCDTLPVAEPVQIAEIPPLFTQSNRDLLFAVVRAAGDDATGEGWATRPESKPDAFNATSSFGGTTEQGGEARLFFSDKGDFLYVRYSNPSMLVPDGQTTSQAILNQMLGGLGLLDPAFHLSVGTENAVVMLPLDPDNPLRLTGVGFSRPYPNVDVAYSQQTAQHASMIFWMEQLYRFTNPLPARTSPQHVSLAESCFIQQLDPANATVLDEGAGRLFNGKTARSPSLNYVRGDGFVSYIDSRTYGPSCANGEAPWRVSFWVDALSGAISQKGAPQRNPTC